MLNIDHPPLNSSPPEAAGEVEMKAARDMNRVDGVGAMRAGGAQDQGSCWLPHHVEGNRRPHCEVRPS
jgi:hypothetical protein